MGKQTHFDTSAEHQPFCTRAESVSPPATGELYPQMCTGTKLTEVVTVPDALLTHGSICFVYFYASDHFLLEFLRGILIPIVIPTILHRLPFKRDLLLSFWPQTLNCFLISPSQVSAGSDSTHRMALGTPVPVRE